MPVINWLGVLVAWIASWLVHGIWYMVFNRPWISALGWTETVLHSAGGRRRMPLGAISASLLAELIMTLMLAGIIGHMGGPTIAIGLVSAALIWFGFVVTTIAINNAFQRRSLTLTVIDSGGWLAVLLVQGLVLGLFR